MNRYNKLNLSKLLIYLALILLTVICLYPFWHVAMSSISDGTQLLKHRGLMLLPQGFSLEAYKEVLSNEYIYSGLKNTLFLLGVGIPLDLVMTALAAYVFAQSDLMFKKPLFLFFMLTMYVSGGTIPFYLTLKDLHLTKTLWGIILPFCFTTSYMVILRTSFETVPKSLIEAARLDGAGHGLILFRVVLPLCKSAMAVMALYYGVGIWNGWFWSSAILREKSQYPLQLILRELLITQTQDTGADIRMLETAKYAAMMVSVIPILLIYPFIQKFFKGGVMVGAVKE